MNDLENGDILNSVYIGTPRHDRLYPLLSLLRSSPYRGGRLYSHHSIHRPKDSARVAAIESVVEWLFQFVTSDHSTLKANYSLCSNTCFRQGIRVPITIPRVPVSIPKLILNFGNYLSTSSVLGIWPRVETGVHYY